MTAISTKVNASQELNGVSIHAGENEWNGRMSPVLATPAAVGAGLAGAAAVAGAGAAGIAVGNAAGQAAGG